MFKKIGMMEKILIYKGLKRLVEEGDSLAFHNNDAGHPVYVTGANGKEVKELQRADGPKTNGLFKMLCELTKDIKQECSTNQWWYDFSTWQRFCELAVENNKNRTKRRSNR